MKVIQTAAVFPITDPINLSEPPAKRVMRSSTSNSKWMSDNLFILIKRGALARKGGTNSGPAGYKIKRRNYFRSSGPAVTTKH